MKIKSVPFLKLTSIRKVVETAINDVLRQGVFITGAYFDTFKKEFSEYLNLDNVIPTANCTDALEIVLRSLGIQKGDEVITTAFSWYSDASVIKLVDAKVVFCDIELNHFGIQFSELEAKFNSKTKALILPHLFGFIHPEIEKIATFCSENNIVLIEDCAQAHGATLEGKMAGMFGDVAAFSFYPTKNLGALGDAGALATNNKALAEKCSLWTNYGLKNRNEHVQLGRNSRMDEMQAAILSAKLPFLDADNKKRRKLAQIYFDVLQDSECDLPVKDEGHVYHQYAIRTDKRDELQKFLLTRGIETDIHYPTALSDMEIFKDGQKAPNASLAAKTVLSLPIHPNHSEQDIEYVAKAIKSFFTN